jgi:DNA-binding LytR/AlgR family response regulator
MPPLFEFFYMIKGIITTRSGAMKIPVINKLTLKPQWLEIDDIIYLDTFKGVLSLNDLDNVYSPLRTLTDFNNFLFREGFEQLDKSNLVNIKKIVEYDEFAKTAYFDKLRKDKYVSVSRRNRNKIPF